MFRALRLSFIAIAFIALGILGYRIFYANDSVDRTSTSVATIDQEPVTDLQPTFEEFDKSQFSIDDPLSIWIVATKDRPLPQSFMPDDLRDVEVDKVSDKSAAELSLRKVAATALEELSAAAKADDLTIVLRSGFRDYDLQSFYYNNQVNLLGQAEADRVSARPGTSEHQTGLTADLVGSSGRCPLETCFGDEPEGKWLAANAYKYGFIVRYPDGAEAITGYAYEPWHIRFVGKDLAAEIFDMGVTLEEFFELVVQE